MAAADPLWAILSDPARRHHGWQLPEFFETGDTEIAGVLARGTELGYPRQFQRALDFGCGVGRLTRPLAAHFQDCWGVDISERMISRARELNQDVVNCHFVVNSAPDLRRFDSRSFDLVYSSIVLQHLPSARLARRYIAEFLRLVRPGGLVVFQMPYHIPWRNRLQLRRRLYSILRAMGLGQDFLYRRAGLNPIRMIAIPEWSVRRHVEQHGGRVLESVTYDDYAGPIRSLLYFVVLTED